MPRVVLVTRPEAEAQQTAERLRSLGYEPMLAPVLEIRPRELLQLSAGSPQAVLVTSGNALPALPATLHAVPLLAVGDATAARARAMGFVSVASAGRDAEALLALACRLCRPEAPPLLLAVGAGQGGALAAGLRRHGFRVARRVAYAARPVARLPVPALRALAARRVAAALFFSPASAGAFAQAVRRGGQDLALRHVTAVAISHPTAARLAPLPWAGIRVASRPNQDELLACLS